LRYENMTPTNTLLFVRINVDASRESLLTVSPAVR
jgi:hypothetical protein